MSGDPSIDGQDYREDHPGYDFAAMVQSSTTRTWQEEGADLDFIEERIRKMSREEYFAYEKTVPFRQHKKRLADYLRNAPQEDQGQSSRTTSDMSGRVAPDQPGRLLWWGKREHSQSGWVGDHMKPTEAELLGFPKPETTVQQAAQSIFVELDKLATAGTDGILGEQWGEFFRSRVNAIPEQLISYSSMILNAIDAANKEKAAAGGVNAPPTELEKHVHNLALATNITASVGIFWKVLHDYAQGKLRLRFPETAASIVANASDYLVQHYEKSYLGLLSAAAHSFGTRFGMDASAALQILYDQRQDQAGERRGAIDHGDDRCGVNFGHPAMMTSACAPSSGNPRLVSNVPVVPGPAVAPPSTPRMR